MFLIAGLGNPGADYVKTRHNIGFRFIDFIHDEVKAPQWKESEGAFITRTQLFDNEAILVKPQKFMNLSGVPISALARYWKVPVSKIVVAYDELDLPFETVRRKVGGGEAGHNGARSVTENLGSKDYHRIRFGVGKPTHPSFEIIKWVLSNFSKEEEAKLAQLFDIGMGLLKDILVSSLKSNS